MEPHRIPLLLLGTSRRNNSNTAFQLNSRWPKRASLRRQYSKGVKVASGCSGHQWNQAEINEMLLNVGKGDLRGLSHRLPGPSKQDPPLSLGDWRKSRPAPLHTAQGGRKPALGSWSTADPYPHCTPTAVPGGETKTQRRAFTARLRVLGGAREGGREIPEERSGVSDGILAASKIQRSLDCSISRPTSNTG